MQFHSRSVLLLNLISVFLLLLTACAFHGVSELKGVEVGDEQRQILVTFALRYSGSVKRAGSSGKQYGGVYQQTILNDKIASMLAERYGLRKVKDWPIKILAMHCVVYEIPEGRDIAEVMELLQQDTLVDAVQLMQQFKTQSQSYNDPYLNLQHSIRLLDVESVHRVSVGRDVKLAIIDTGMDTQHPEFEKRVVSVHDFAADHDVSGGLIHGTAVAGVIAAAANNSIGIVGVAPAVKLLALKACWQIKSSSSEAVCNSFTLAQAMDTAISERAQILNLSLAGPDDPLLKRLLEKALQEGVIVIAADDGDEGFPASMPGVIAVASSEMTVPQTLNRLYAPGGDILTTMPGGEYDFMSGSSFAAAQVSGIVALLLERKNDLNAVDVMGILKSTSLSYQEIPLSRVFLVDACLALASVVSIACAMQTSP